MGDEVRSRKTFSFGKLFDSLSELRASLFYGHRSVRHIRKQVEFIDLIVLSEDSLDDLVLAPSKSCIVVH